MINLNQKIKIKWNNGTKKHYENLGYKFTKLHDEFEITANDLTPKSKENVVVYCDDCGKQMDKSFFQYNRIIEQQGEYNCKACATKRRFWQTHSKEDYFNKFIEFCNRNNYIQVTTIDEYINAKQKLYYICPLHGYKYIILDAINDDNCGCRECSYDIISSKNKHTNDYIINFVRTVNNDELLNPEDYKNVNENNMIIRCGSCGDIFTTSLASLTSGGGRCNECAKKAQIEHSRLSVEEVIERCTIHGEVMVLNPAEYKKNSIKNLVFRCKGCGEIYVTSLTGFLNGQTMCNKCRHIMSCGEEAIDDVLNKYNINHFFQYRFEDCMDIRVLPFDFFLPDYNLIIEFDGQFHFEPIYGDEHIQMIQRHDEIKNDYCRNNDIGLLRIPYWEGHNIEKIIMEKLKL